MVKVGTPVGHADEGGIICSHGEAKKSYIRKQLEPAIAFTNMVQPDATSVTVPASRGGKPVTAPATGWLFGKSCPTRGLPWFVFLLRAQRLMLLQGKRAP